MSFDSVLDRSLVTSDVVAGPSSADHVVVTRRYQAAHNIGWFRFVEYSAVDDQGEPRGISHQWPTSSSRSTRSCARPPLRRRNRAGLGEPREHPHRPARGRALVEERYTVDPAGIIAVSLTDLTTGYRQEHVLQA